MEEHLDYSCPACLDRDHTARRETPPALNALGVPAYDWRTGKLRSTGCEVCGGRGRISVTGGRAAPRTRGPAKYRREKISDLTLSIIRERVEQHAGGRSIEELAGKRGESWQVLARAVARYFEESERQPSAEAVAQALGYTSERTVRRLLRAGREAELMLTKQMLDEIKQEIRTSLDEGFGEIVGMLALDRYGESVSDAAERILREEDLQLDGH